MPTFSEFFSKFGWPEFIITIAIILAISSIHEWRNFLGLFGYGKNKKKDK